MIFRADREACRRPTLPIIPPHRELSLAFVNDARGEFMKNVCIAATFRALLEITTQQNPPETPRGEYTFADTSMPVQTTNGAEQT